MKNRQSIIFVLLAVLILASFYERGYFNRGGGIETGGAAKISSAYENRLSNLQVEGSGLVEKVLRDDLEGSRHQRIILRVSDSQTVLIAHNIDLAPRVPADEGDELEFKGEYEYSEQGGVLHWTHHDPRRRHPNGWLRHKGSTYK